jgi:hypothetical protein
MRHRRLLHVIAAVAALAWLAPLASAQSHVGKPPSWADPFYTKYLDARGVAVMGSPNVSDRAIAIAQATVSHMLAKRPDLAQSMAQQHAIVAVFAENERFTDIPEMRRWRGVTNRAGHNLDAGCGGGAVKHNPVTTICERQLLDDNAKFATLVHEFGHSVQNLALDEATLAAIRTAYQHAQHKGLFRKADGQTPAYLMNNEHEFFADTTTMWFNGYNPTNPANTPFVATRAQLKTYDSEIYQILAGIYPDDDWMPLRHAPAAR